MVAPVHVIGGGLAGSEAAFQLAAAGLPVVLHEMRPNRGTEAHQTAAFAELVCSNSFRSDDWATNAVGLLHEEMRRAGSLILQAADAHKLPAGGALAVDRDGFAAAVTERLERHPLITIAREEVDGRPPAAWDSVVVATGPLTSPALADAIRTLTGADALAFFDAIAPIVYRDTVDMEICWLQSRYDKAGPGGSGADYINCPLNDDPIRVLHRCAARGREIRVQGLGSGHALFRRLPAHRGHGRARRETLRHGPMKPVGLTNPRRPGVKPYAVVQLRQDNALGTLWNMVGFQTKLKHSEQARIFRTIPGLEAAEFARLGGLHRNTFLNSPELLDAGLRLKADPRLRFAGQITGVEGYVESAAIGLLAGRFAAAERQGRRLPPPPPTTALGALLAHITGGHLSDGGSGAQSFQPMNVNFGLFPPLAASPPPRMKGQRGAKAVARKEALTARALTDLARWLAEPASIAAE